MGTLLPSGDILLQSIGGSHANSLLGRFAYLDGKMGEFCKEISDTEKQAELQVIFAEIIHIPEGRIGNIARRPVLSDYEIPLLAYSGLEIERQIPVSDLLVSVQEDEIILRSKRLNKRVIPRLSNAHNYANSLVPVYKFLSSIQHQGKPGLDINLREFDSGKRFLPRLSYRNIILHRACWLLLKNDINAIIKAENSISKLREFFLKWNVPRFVCFAEGDNELFIDTSNNSYLEILVEEIKTHNFVKLLEWYYNADTNDGKDKAIVQFILPLSKRTPVHPSPFVEAGIINTIRRTFEPGSEWIYFKIYCGARLSDHILLNVIKPAINSLLIEKIITKAFFIRYTDPHYHLRFRLHLSDGANKIKWSSALSCIYDLLHPFSSDRLVWKVQLDTYQREIERYGENSILISEKLFFQDSLLYLNCLVNEEFREDAQIRFLSALKNMDKWFTVFNMSLQEKADFCMVRSDTFGKEFGSRIKSQLDLKYRELKNLVFPFLGSEKYDSEFTKRDKVLHEMLLPKENLPSYIHMSMNRWFITQQRLMEYMCYLFLCKYYNEILHQNNRIQLSKINQ
jgi:thiopeptide-type bacteriocin biosynthesis protein